MMGIPKYYGLKGHSLALTISFIAGLDFLLFGYDQGVTGGLLDLPAFIRHFPSIDTRKPSTCTQYCASANAPGNAGRQGITVAAYNLGCFAGAVLTIFIGNPLGRRRTIFAGSIIMTIGAILQATSFQLGQFVVARVITGIGNGLNTSTVPTWQSETAKSHQRGRLVMIEGMLITAGIAISYWINYGFAWIGDKEVAWRFPVAFQIFFALIILASILNLPESPRWLVMQGRDDEAMAVLEALNDTPREDPAMIAEFASVKKTVEEMSKGSYRSLFEMSDYREFHRVCLAYVNQMFQQISGINLITYYAPTLYTQVGLPGKNIAKLMAACNGTEYLLASFLPIFIIERVGRRPLMLVGAAGMSISMAVLAATNWYLTDPAHETPSGGHTFAAKQAGYAQAAFLFIFNTFFAFGWLGMTWLYPAEIVPLKIRAPTNALATSGNWIFNFMVVMITPPAFANIGYQTYIIFAVINFVMFPIVYLFFPETRYRSLEEMDDIFKKSTNVFDVVDVSLKEPYRFDKQGQLKSDYIEDGSHVSVRSDASRDGEKRQHRDTSD